MPVAASGSYKMFKESSGTLFWSDSPSLNQARMEFGSAGDEDNALVFGGLGGCIPSSQFTYWFTEEWNGSSWSIEDNLTTMRAGNAGFGTSNAAISNGGAQSAYNYSNTIILAGGQINSEGYNGTSWSTAASTNNTARWFRCGTGTQNAGTVVGGQNGGLSCDEVEWYDGVSWSSRPDLNCGIALNVLVGNQGDEFTFGGAYQGRYGGGPSSFLNGCTNQASIGGISWEYKNDLNTQRVGLAGTGTQNAAIAVGGGDNSFSFKCTEEWNGLTWSNVGKDSILPVDRNGAKIIGTLKSIPTNISSSLTVVGGSTLQYLPDIPFESTQDNYFNTTFNEPTNSIAHGLEEGGSLNDPTQFNTQITDSTSSKYDTFFSGDIKTKSDVSESLQWRNYPGEEQCIASASFEEIFYPGGDEDKYEVTFVVNELKPCASGSVNGMFGAITASWVASANGDLYGSSDGSSWYDLNTDVGNTFNMTNLTAAGNNKLLIGSYIADVSNNLKGNFTSNTLPSGTNAFTYSEYYNYFIAEAGNYAYTSSNGSDWGQAGQISDYITSSPGEWGHDDSGNIIYTQWGAKYFYSQDGGVTWKLSVSSLQGTMLNNGAGESITYSNNKWFWVNTRTGLYESSNPFVDFEIPGSPTSPWTSSYSFPSETNVAGVIANDSTVVAFRGVTEGIDPEDHNVFITASVNPNPNQTSSFSSIDALTSSMDGLTSGWFDEQYGFLIAGENFVVTSSNGTDWGNGATVRSNNNIRLVINTGLAQRTFSTPPSDFFTVTGSKNQTITGNAYTGSNSTFVGWSSTPVFNVPRIFRLFRPVYNLIETSTTLNVDLEEENQTYYAIFDCNVIEKKYCYTTSDNRNDICLECQEEKTIYFNKINYKNTGSEGITWYEDINLSITASDGYYYLSGSDNPIVYSCTTGSAEFELICEGDVIYCS